MKRLKDVIRALHEEISAALDTAPAASAAVQATRIVVTLRFRLGDDPAGAAGISFLALQGMPDAEGERSRDPEPHTMTIEFERTALTRPAVELDRGDSRQSEPAALLSSPGDATRGGEPAIMAPLIAMFGEPGFDNAARATVFREIIESLSGKQLAALVDSFASDPGEAPRKKSRDPAVATARLRITRLLRLGPGGIPSGVAALVKLFREHPAGVVLGVLSDRWKTQSDWVQTDPPGVRLVDGGGADKL